MNATRTPATEDFDAETLGLLEAVEVPLPEFTGLDLDVAFGTPLDLYEPAGSQREMRAYAAAVVAAPTSQRHQLSRLHGAEIQARIDAGRDILTDDPALTARVRERLVDVLLPHAAQLRITPPTAAPLPIAA
ncbi:hypothetical protein DIZ27_37805 [Streptomyces sp. NWU339]|uniref:hypothetical protein n=1 Tax=Streptomyces sp. NWU339 TaxID=2185284 RepID=UPI000D674DC6|nr:hypothetical protein [Streptomyces sp. NWU339]PWI05688.1 hypothetical protein DIZ27_37805 [Streptomyces sp. NWU339]